MDNSPNELPRLLPSEKRIRARWVDLLWEIKGFDSPEEFLEPGTCFACGRKTFVVRAHIVARVEGGSDDVENLNMLCEICHKDSEMLEGERYKKWLIQRTEMDVVVSGAVRGGFNLYSELVAAGIWQTT